MNLKLGIYFYYIVLNDHPEISLKILNNWSYICLNMKMLLSYLNSIQT